MKTFGLAIAAAVATLMVSAPAMAEDFTGPRVGVTGGVIGDDVFSTTEQIFGVEAGYDFNLGGATLGAQVSYEDALEGSNDNLVALTARVGLPVDGGGLLVYGTAGYVNASGDDGYRLGGGLEVGLPGNLTAKVEQRYDDLGGGADGFSTVVGLGLRF